MFVSKLEKESRKIRKQATGRTTYSTMIIDGEKLFQIQSYSGSGLTDGAKQTMQFNKNGAEQLIEILKEEFNL